MAETKGISAVPVAVLGRPSLGVSLVATERVFAEVLAPKGGVSGPGADGKARAEGSAVRGRWSRRGATTVPSQGALPLAGTPVLGPTSRPGPASRRGVRPL